MDSAPPSEHAGVARAGGLSAVGASAAAIASSACCWLPLTLLAFGASAAGASAFFERWRPYFAAAAFALLGLGFYFAYFRAGACADDDSSCARSARRRLRIRRALLWASAGFVLVFVSFPQYVGSIYALLDNGPQATAVQADGASPAAPANALFYRVEGMTCQGCAAGLQAELARLPGIESAAVDFQSKTATIQTTGDDDASTAADASDVASKLGFSLTPAPVSPPIAKPSKDMEQSP